MFKPLKKLTALALAGAMLFTGCTGKDGKSSSKYDKLLDPQKPVSIEIWHYSNGPQKIAFDDLVAEFNETVGQEKGIVVNAVSQGNVNDLMQKVTDAANKKVGADEVPDIFAAYTDTAYAIDQLGLVADLDPYLTGDELDEYVASYIQEGRFGKGDPLKIFPTAKSTELMMLNKTDWDKFSAATGVTVDQLSTVEGLCEVAEKYYDYSGGKAFFGRDAMANYMLIGARQLGCELFSVKNGNVKLDLDKEVLKKLWDGYYVPYVHGYFAAKGRFRSDDAKTGDLIALVGSTSGAAYFPGQVVTSDTESYPIDAMVLEPPVFAGGEKYAVQQGAGMVVTKSDEATEYACTVFLKWFTDSQRNLEFSVSSGYLPVKTAANKVSSVDKALQSTAGDDSSVTQNLQLSLPVAVGMVQNYTLYTTQGFENGNDARNVLEKSMQQKADEDLKKVQAAVAGGQSQKQAADSFCTDENFDSWYDSFCQQVESAVNKG